MQCLAGTFLTARKVCEVVDPYCLIFDYKAEICNTCEADYSLINGKCNKWYSILLLICIFSRSYSFDLLSKFIIILRIYSYKYQLLEGFPKRHNYFDIPLFYNYFGKVFSYVDVRDATHNKNTVYVPKVFFTNRVAIQLFWLLKKFLNVGILLKKRE